MNSKTEEEIALTEDQVVLNVLQSVVIIVVVTIAGMAMYIWAVS